MLGHDEFKIEGNCNECEFCDYDQGCFLEWSITEKDYDLYHHEPGPFCPGEGVYKLVKSDIIPTHKQLK